MRSLFRAFVALVMCAASATAQQIRVRGYGEPEVDALVRAALAANPIIITRDTLIPARDTIRGNVVVVKARFVLEGAVQGDLTGLNANIYLRPPARVSGQVLNVTGGLYPSELAKVGSMRDHPLAPYRVNEIDGGYEVEGMIKRPALKLLGGFQIPEYNRVDGLRVEVGPSILLPPVAGVEPRLSASIGYATERKDALGRVRLDLKRGNSTLSTGWEDDITLTNEDWIKSAAKNSLSTIWNGKDYRNYYKADRVFVEFRRFVETGPRTTFYWVRGQNEIADPLAAQTPWSLFKPDSIRPNWLVPHSRVASLILGANSQFKGTSSAFNVGGSLEFAGNRGTGTNTSFNAFVAHATYATRAIANHTLEIETNFRGPLPGTEDLPMQRWSFVGGSGTLYTARIAEFPGDRVAFVETEYRIPFNPRFHLPILGTPTLRLMHNMGMAWSRTSDKDWEQEFGGRVQFAFAHARYLYNPSRSKGKLDFGVSLASRGYPWEKSPRR